MSHTIKANGPHDFLAAIPALAGFQPENSMVIVPFNSRRANRAMGAVRLDLSAVRQVTVAGDLLDHFAAANSVVLIVYTDDEWAEPMNYGPEVFAIREDLEHRGYSILDLLLVARDGWGSYYDGKRHSLDEIGSGNVKMTNPANATHTDYALLPEGIEVGPGIADRIDRHERIVGEQAVEVIEDVLTSHDDDLLGDLAMVLAYPSTRDGALLQWSRGKDWGTRSMVTRDPEDEQILSAHVDLATGYGPVPNPERLHNALRAVKHVAAWLPEPERSPALSTAGWLAWALGMGSASAMLLTEAIRLDPEYNFAWILRKYISSGRIPQWAFEVADQRSAES